MKDRAGVAESRLTRAELLEVFCGLGHNAAVQTHFDATRGFTANTDVKEYGVSYLGFFLPEQTLKHTPNLEGCRADVLLLKHRLGRESHTHRGTCDKSKNRVHGRKEHGGNKNKSVVCLFNNGQSIRRIGTRQEVQ